MSFSLQVQIALLTQDLEASLAHVLSHISPGKAAESLKLGIRFKKHGVGLGYYPFWNPGRKEIMGCAVFLAEGHVA